MRLSLLDFESRSLADLKKIGGRLYWEHPTTVPIVCVLHRVDTNERITWLPGDPNPLRDGEQYAAQNATGFDRFGCVALGWRTPEDPWIDTAEYARVAGLPGALDALAQRWLGTEKDATGSAVTRSLSRTGRLGGVPEALHPSFKRYHRALKASGPWPEIPADILERVIGYCHSDVDTLVYAWPRLAEWDLECERPVAAVDRAINDRGIRFDRELARRLLEEDERNAVNACAAVAAQLNLREPAPASWDAERVRAAASSPKQFVEITGAPNAQAETISKLDHPLARAREAIASIARGKLRAGLERTSPDGRLRDSLRYYGASTGRWSGRGMQLQNMPRPAKRFEDWADEQICALADSVIAGGHATQDEIDLLVRASLCAEPGNVLIWEDFSGVEARANAWAAGDADALDVFASGKDPYKVMASTIYQVAYEEIGKDERRQVGKIAELACGYGLGSAKFTSGNPDMKWGSACGRDEPCGNPLCGQISTNRQRRKFRHGAHAIVMAWRALHQPIVQFWSDLEEGFDLAARGEANTVGPFEFCPATDGSYVALLLPSGRPIVYNEPRFGERRPDDDEDARPGWSYQGTDPWRTHLYGGILCENAIQAFCRDKMAECMVEVEAAGMPIVLTVHDEIVIEVPEVIADECAGALHQIMVDVLGRSEGFPAAAAGGRGRRYRK